MKKIIFMLPLISMSVFASEPSLYSNEACAPAMKSIYSTGYDYGSTKFLGVAVKGIKVDMNTCIEQDVCKFIVKRQSANSWSGVLIANSAKTTVNGQSLTYDAGKPIIYYAYTNGSIAGKDFPGQCFIKNLSTVGFNQGMFGDNEEVMMENTGLSATEIEAMGFQFK
ncbi:hypothetical protein [Aeromonas sp. SG16]|uniref:hypothetical protein n=1 Tax=Aeromonas sp. SG16 TaxID=2950548 RepID=UPI00210B4A41|nr:hypothetical protein [Aeromonas sp. SG16]MCQ4054455.1 hypothetical protein [Aeromonas sp. SG16]